MGGKRGLTTCLIPGRGDGPVLWPDGASHDRAAGLRAAELLLLPDRGHLLRRNIRRKVGKRPLAIGTICPHPHHITKLAVFLVVVQKLLFFFLTNTVFGIFLQDFFLMAF